jgi:hypothetical protein
MTARRRRTLAIELLAELVERQLLDERTIAARLSTPRPAVAAWLAGALAMPTDHQLALASLVIDRVPALARRGYRLLDHARARLAFDAGITKTHMTAPISRFKPPGRVIAARPPG